MRRSMLTALAAALAGATACSIQEKAFDPLACSGPAHQPASSQATISGSVVEAVSQAPIGMGVPVELHLRSDDALITMKQTDPGGGFKLQLAAELLPLGVYLRVSASGFLETRYYPARPIDGDFNTNIQVLTMDVFAEIGRLVPIDPAKAFIVVTANNCDGNPVGGATVTTSPPADLILYIGEGGMITDTGMTNAKTGSAFAINVAVNTSTNITGAVGNRMLSGDPFASVPNVILQADIQP